ncbi:MAG TPA: response regulator [Methylomirabilota bacterium]|nr:response regulator [Methylomirabilota bacterium]
MSAVELPKGRRVLLVDDDAMVLHVVREMLATDDHRVDTALDGLEALQHIERKTYDLIVTDIRMPGLDGMGLYRAIQQRRPELLPRVLFIATPRDDDATRAFLHETAAWYLAKPFGLEDLRRVVGQVLRGAESGPAAAAAG